MRNVTSLVFQLLIGLVVVLDFICLVIALVLGYWLWVTFPWHGRYQPFEDFVLIIWIAAPIGLIVFNAVGLYKQEMGVMGVQEQSLIFKAVFMIYVVILSLTFFYREIEFSRLSIFYSFFIAILFVSTERFLLRHLNQRLNAKGIAVRNAVIYGAGYHGQRLERWIRQSPQLGIRVLGFLDDHLETLMKKPQAFMLLGKLEDLKNLARRKNIRLLYIAYRNLNEEKVMKIFRLCHELGIQCWAIPSFYKFHVEKAELQTIGGIPLVGFKQSFERRIYGRVKRFLDILMASLLLVLTAPFMAAVMTALICTSGRPMFFKQTRIGQNGKKFILYKFRTLRAGGQKDQISPELQKGGDTTTPLGAFLRRTGLDELPQLINVVKGDMSLVGPRPEMPFIAEHYGPLEKERLSVKPGITGLWQISDDRKRLLIHENMDYDLYYIEHLSFNLDLAILLKTVWVVFRRLLW
jgi:exopolysaccharide biosynthesis polyprenyl glycosylphosphotransferase